MQFRSMTAAQELNTPALVSQVIPLLVGKGLSLEDAFALGHNLVLLYLVLVITPAVSSPEELLFRLSLDEISSLCERYYASDEVGFSAVWEEDVHDTCQ